MSSSNHHDAVVADWSRRVAANLTPSQHLQAFERALGALWQRAHLTLGEVTLMAITDRVVSIAAERFPWTAGIKVAPTGPRLEDIHERTALDAREVAQGAQFVLAEFLTLLANLTGEILTPALHAELSRLSVPGARESPGTAKRSNTAGEEQNS